MKDSGKRDEYSTGSVRDSNKGKGAYELISPMFMRRLAVHLEKGAEKYPRLNWRKGYPMSRTAQSLLRHMFQWLGGDDSEDHLAAVASNIMFLIHYEECITNGIISNEIDDVSEMGEYRFISEETWLENLNGK